jgi:hypothetical protein
VQDYQRSLINPDVPTKNILITPDAGMLNTKYFDTWHKGPVGEILPAIKDDLIAYLNS